MLSSGKFQIHPFHAKSSDTSPKYKLVLKNQTDSGEGDFVQTVDDNVRFEVKEGTFFYQYVRELYTVLLFVSIESAREMM
jgi:hypothetical protein